MNGTIRSSDLQMTEGRGGSNAWTRALIISATLGFSADLIGISLCAASYPGILPGSELLNLTGTWLIAGGLPFIFFAAHCLDKIDSNRHHNATV